MALTLSIPIEVEPIPFEMDCGDYYGFYGERPAE